MVAPYPDARRGEVVDVLHGTEVADPYRWLEDANDSECQAWSEAQDRLARAYLDALPGRRQFASRLRELMPGAVSAPAVRPNGMFVTRRRQHQEHPTVEFHPTGSDHREVGRVLIDPALIDPSLATTLDGYWPSPEGVRVAYLLSEGGREEATLYVIDVESGDRIEGPLVLGRGATVAWSPGGDELFVVRSLAGQFDRRVYRHRIGEPLDAAEEVFGAGRDRTTYYGIMSSLDGRWLVISCSLGTAPRNDVYLLDLDTETIAEVQEGDDVETHAWVGRDGHLYLFTNRDAPRWKLAVADPERPDPSQWRDLLPQDGGGAVLNDITVTDEHLVAVWTRDVASEVTQHERLGGALIGQLHLPGRGMASVTSALHGGEDVWVSYTDELTPGSILHAHLASGPELELWEAADGAPDAGPFVTDQIFYSSTDGTSVPMTIVRRRGVDTTSGPHPTILYGYGGFNIALTPAYSNTVLAWVEAGGVYAIANLRGGSEYGEEWHRAGMRANKQQVFDDFYAAAEWLFEHGWTDPMHLAAAGGSNGGLLVGAALTQRPDLFRAAYCSAPLLDMVRYELHGLGETWNDEYGTAHDPEQFRWLYRYSPYHRVDAGVAYPAVIFTVFEGDTRVDPLHARKMCAALQAATSAPFESRPIVIRREVNVGHSTRAVSRTIELQTDTLSFLAHQLELAVDPPGLDVAATERTPRLPTP